MDANYCSDYQSPWQGIIALLLKSKCTNTTVGAKPLGKYRIDQVVVGIEKPEMVLVVEFPRESAFREVLVPQVKKILTTILNKEVRSRLVKDRPAKNTRTLCLQQAKH